MTLAHSTYYGRFRHDCIACFVRVGFLFSIARYPYFYDFSVNLHTQIKGHI
jgi:hypothetical protein